MILLLHEHADGAAAAQASDDGARRGVGFPRPGGPDGWEGPCGCGNQTQVLLTEQ